MSNPLRLTLLGVLWISAIAPAAEPADSFRADLRALTARPHRLAGTDFAGEAADYVAKRLRQIGVDELHVLNFPVPHLRTLECSLTVDGQTHRDIYPMRPNHLQGATTPPEGLTGRTVYGGKGRLEEYTGDPRDAVVVLDFSAADRWKHAFAMGAKAVVFVGEDTPAPNTFHHLNIPANLPRFFVTAETAERLKLKTTSRTVTIRAACRWEMLEGRNVIGVLRGTQPRFDLDRDEAIMLSAPLDSLSEVPALSPGARHAANCAALLALTQHLKDNRPRRDVIVCFLDGDAFNHAGARALFGTLYRQKEKGKYKPAGNFTLEKRLAMFQEEADFLGRVQAVLAHGNVFSDAAKDLDGQKATVIQMRAEAKALAAPLRDRLQLIRTDRRRIEEEIEQLQAKRGPAAEEPAEAEPSDRIQQLKASVKALDETVKALRAEDLAWSELERALNDSKYPAENSKILDKYNLLLKEIGRLTDARLAELELAIDRTRQGQALAESIGDERNVVILNLVLNLGDRSGRWTFIHGQDSQGVHNTPDTAAAHTKIFQAIRAIAEKRAPRLFEPRPTQGLYNIRMFAPGLFAHSGAVAGVFGVPNLAIMTPMDRRPRDGQPCDLVRRTEPDGTEVQVLKISNMLQAMEEFGPFVADLCNTADLSIPSNFGPVASYTEVKFSGGKRSGASAYMLSGASAMPDRPARGGFVAVMRRPLTKVWEGARVDQTPPGFEPQILAKVDVNGRIELPPLSKEYYASGVAVAATFDERGLIRFINNTTTLNNDVPLTRIGSVLFQATGMTAVGLGYDRGAVATRALKASSTAPLIDDRSLVCESGNVLTVYAPLATERLKLFNASGMVVLGNADAKNRIVGEGLPVDPFAHWPSAVITARDLHVLDGERLGILKEHRILETSLEKLHIEAGDLRTQAQKLPPDEVARRQGSYAASAAISRRAYKPLLRVLNDLVLAVVLLLLLAIPFAYSLERLLVGTPHIYRQIGWFVALFLVTFVVLYTVNPAFRIAATPIVIFLAFAIILLSTLVIVIMTRKLEAEVRRIQGLGSTIHSSDVSRLGTMMAAVHMGISTMRRRPVRTLLTAVTVVLLTFTILTFASFSSSWGNRRTYTGPMFGPPRILVRHPFWSRISEEVPTALEAFFADDADVVTRYWVAQTASEVEERKNAGWPEKVILAADAEGKKIVALSALVGLDTRDVKRLPELREVLAGDIDLLAADGAFLTSAVARELDLKPGDPVCIDGLDCTLAGILDRKKVTNYRLLEGSNMLPVDYEASGGGRATTFQQQESASVEDLPEMESAQFIYFSPDRVAILPAKLARRVGGRTASITIYPREDKDVEKMGQRVATITGLPTYLGSKGGVYRLFFTSLTQASGWKDLVIPVFLGGLIIFATMLGSVSDREKEIYAFSALGLAPPHVASLFFAEASVYAVVGGMGGYLLGQVVSRALTYVSETFGILSVPTMNYSSTNAIATVLVVMCTVLVSTIYPAMKASRSANPGIQRSWKIGRPVGDLHDIVFPFTVSAYDITGVVSFLKEHFGNFSDTALGVFATTSCHIFRQKNDMLGVRAEVALAPFDLGVSQKFALLAQPSEIEGIQEIRILLRRLSGTRGDWQRSNRVFINELRKQLLIWRSVSPEIMEQYRQSTLQQWKQLPVEDVHPDTFGVRA